MYLFFDTETTGLPLNWNVPMKQVDNWPRIIQLAFILYNEDREIVTEYNELILPDGWVVPNEKFWIENGFTTEQNNADGVPIREAIKSFIESYHASNLLIAHNINYDHNVLGAEMIRANMKATRLIPRFCTMSSTTDYCQLTSPRGRGFKWPKLQELHLKLFGEEFDDAHDALADVKATASCFFELIEKGVIDVSQLADRL